MIFMTLYINDIIAIIAVALIIFIILWYFLTIRSIHQLEVRINEAESGIDVAIQKRIAIIVNIITIINNDDEFEPNTINEIRQWFKEIPQNATLSDRARMIKQMNTITNWVVSNKKISFDWFPKDLFVSLSDNKENLKIASEYYNSLVNQLNMKIKSFPQSLVANAIYSDQRPYFVLEDEK
ncbi:MAG: LemA family protein [Candidatus Izemoplasmatales bacterium]|jgi:LemA protein|nr:LemA family protein [Candidatus Izemoplasmatales bacterium]MDD3864857.1 LemA family protein [Candidatus Izemoplasmatales bacterium]